MEAKRRGGPGSRGGVRQLQEAGKVLSRALVLAAVELLVAGFIREGALARAEEPRPPATIKRVRYLVGPQRVRVLVILSRQVPYEVLQLPAGDGHAPRLVVDFANARLDVRARTPQGEASGALLAFRTGQFNPRTARVVLEMEGIGAHATVSRDHPPRVVIDVEVPREGASDSAGKPRSNGAKRVKEEARDGSGRELASAGQASKAGSKPPRAVQSESASWVVVVDPGHGGADPGAIGLGGLVEKQVTLSVSKKLSARLARNPSIDVFLTRERDVTLPLRARTAFANSHGADLFISIHTNADDTGTLSGVETFYLNNADDHATVRLAAQENGLVPPGADLKVDRDVLYIVSDLVQSGKEEESVELAHHVQASLTRKLSDKRGRVNDLGVRKGPFFVLTGAYMPCVLVEVSFISHAREGRLLADTRYQEEIAEGIYQGIVEFLRSSEVAKTL